FDNIRRWEGAIIFLLVVGLSMTSRLFIYSFRHIPLTGHTGGEEPLYALVGGAALALSVPMLPLLVLYLTSLFTLRKGSSELDEPHKATMIPATFFLLTFVTAFVVTISGTPYVLASAIYKGKGIINLAGGILVVFFGLKAFIESGLIASLRLVHLSKSKRWILAEAPIVGFMAGLLLFHYLDPFYDSVFFFTGRAGALSHHPISIISFGLGLSAIYLALAYAFSLLIVSMPTAKSIAWVRGILGVLTLSLGFSLATGKFSSMAIMIKGP
ncbi:MAG: hypothetical protein AABZ09_00120, partial [Candidatus Binatota bacterium]